jgi:hypothetical protein
MKKREPPIPVRLNPVAKAKLAQIIEDFRLDNRNQAINFAVENLGMLRDLIQAAKDYLPYSKFQEFEGKYKLLVGKV